MGDEKIYCGVSESTCTGRARWWRLEKDIRPWWQWLLSHVVIPRPLEVSTGSLHTGECPVPSLWWLALTSTLFWIKIHNLNVFCPQSPVLSMPQWLGALSHQTHQSLCWWLRTTLVFLVYMFHPGKNPTKCNNLCSRKKKAAFFLSQFIFFYYKDRPVKDSME